MKNVEVKKEKLTQASVSFFTNRLQSEKVKTWGLVWPYVKQGEMTDEGRPQWPTCKLGERAH